MVWMVIALPASAVLGCVITIFLVLQAPDRDVRAAEARARPVIHGHAANSVLPPAE
jgi:hypothetical protein